MMGSNRKEGVSSWPFYPIGTIPLLAADEFIAPGAYIIGRVTIGTGFSVWFNAVLRGDMDGGRRMYRTMGA